MKISNNIPIIEHKDVINTFTKNLKKKRKEKGYTQRQLADILDVTLKTYRSWEKNTLPKTLELINLSTILDCDVDFLLGRLQSDTHFQAYIDKTYALSPDAFQKLSIFAYGHFPRPSGPRSPARQGHIKRPVLRLAEPSFLRPANQCC